MKKTVLTISGIRPDFIRMSEIFKKLDNNFNHILVHSGQHYDKLLSGVFFDELEIREPDYNLNIGSSGKKHYHQVGDLSVSIIELIEGKNLKPDIILFLGDSNSVCCSMALKKEGYRIGHIEAGMRSYDRRMLEEINRTVCDHCSDYLFVYHDNYKNKALDENIPEDSIFVVGNTIVEVAMPYVEDIRKKEKKKDFILMDIHRPENFNDKNRMCNIIEYAKYASSVHGLPVKMLGFRSSISAIDNFNIDLGGKIELIDLMSYKEFLCNQYNAKLIISDSGTAQEESCLLGTPVIVPRDYTERPESVENLCSFMVRVDTLLNSTWEDSMKYVDNIESGASVINTKWLGNGLTSSKIIDILKEILL